MTKLQFVERMTDYGTKQVILKSGNKILAWVEERSDKYYYAFGKPSNSNYVSFVVDSIEEGKQKILENLVL